MVKTMELFFDNSFFLSNTDNIQLILNTPQFEQIVFISQFKFENISVYFTILYDHLNHNYKLYYKGSVDKIKDSFCILISTDGLNFSRPLFRLIPSDNDNNILYKDLTCHNMFPFLDPLHSSLHNRFKAIGGHKRANGMFLFTSVDGFIWNKNRLLITANDILPSPVTISYLDALNIIIYDTNKQHYKLFCRHNKQRGYRTIQISESPNLVEWSPFTEINITDDIQIYSPHVFQYPNHMFYLGLFSTMPVGSHRNSKKIDLYYSYDAYTWKLIKSNYFGKVLKGPELSAVNIVSSPDNTKFYMYACEQRTSRLFCFSVRKHGFYKYVRNGPDSGFLISNYIRLASPQINLNFKTFDNGFIQVLILNSFHDIICESILMYGNHLSKYIEWNTLSSPLLDDNIFLKIILNNCELYSLEYDKDTSS